MTPWWFSYETCVIDGGTGTKVELRGIQDPLERAGRARADLVSFLRVRGAVNYDWGNAMTHYLLVSLKRSVVGLVGPCSGQQHGQPPGSSGGTFGNVFLLGGAMQIYLPGLSPFDLDVAGYGTV